MEKTKAKAPVSDNRASMQRRRQFKDKVANIVIAFGGIAVISSIVLIFFYLVFEVKPLFMPVDESKSAPVATVAPARYLDSDEYNETGLRVLANGDVQVVDIRSGQVKSSVHLPVPEGVTIAAVHKASVLSGLVGFGLSNGQLLIAKPDYQVSYGMNNERQIVASLTYPYGDVPVKITEGAPLTNFYVRGDDNGFKVLADIDNKVVRLSFVAESHAGPSEGLSLGFGDEATVKTFTLSGRDDLPFSGSNIRNIVIGQEGIWGYVFHDKNRVTIYNFRAEPVRYEEALAAEPGVEISAVAPLQGDISLLIGDNRGQVAQWFMVRDPKVKVDRFNFTKIRGVKISDGAITAIAAEKSRKGFVAGDEKGVVTYYYTTSERLIAQEQAATTPIRLLAMSPRSDGVLVQSEDSYSFWHMSIQHPDISFSTLWQKVWYESYSAPTYTWQSSSGSTDFESKLSLMPLTFGTLKAAFYAMLLGAPLAVLGAMYTATFMAPALRRKAKPTIELMAALPTVILGFLAGLWLAPTIEANLPGIFSLLILTPLGILLVGMLWSRLPLEKRSFSEGWAPVILILPILLIGWFSFALSQPVEVMFFGGDVRLWLEQTTGLPFDQRNALIVGLVMGFAVIPNIYAISEDALFAVPRHLTNGSLALGATPWQTLVRVVLPTASPGIFSALMIGMGRAVGETMIVLMATGNSAVMDWNIFQGMRTLSANVAVEMGEAEVGSTHFRVLFLSALVLFVLTFILNTAAEIVRSRLRKKYGSL